MLRWLRNGRRPKVGDDVEIVGGPYAGRSGVITGADGGSYEVFIDECCRPTLEAAQLRRLSRRSLTHLVRDARESDPISEEARATTEIRDWVDSQGPH